MTYEQACDYINFAHSEGYIGYAERERLLNLPIPRIIDEVEKIADRGDDAT